MQRRFLSSNHRLDLVPPPAFQPHSSPSVISPQHSTLTYPAERTQELSVLKQCLEALSMQEKLGIICQAFSTITDEPVPSDYLGLVCKRMRNLRDAGRCNVLYLLAKAVGTMREDGRDTL